MKSRVLKRKTNTTDGKPAIQGLDGVGFDGTSYKEKGKKGTSKNSDGSIFFHRFAPVYVRTSYNQQISTRVTVLKLQYICA